MEDGLAVGNVHHGIVHADSNDSKKNYDDGCRHVVATELETISSLKIDA